MVIQVLRTVLKGIIGGACFGFLIGAYIVVLSKAYVIRSNDFTYPMAYEETEERYASTLVLFFVTVFAVIGPYIAAASYGPWLRHGVYGLVCSVAAVVVTTLIAASIADQQPFNMHKTATSEWIDLARVYLLPGALVAGPVIGMWVGRFLRRSGPDSSTNSPPQSPPPNVN
jgi:uncharacterized sodium:solute symporter family permease YidK